MLIYHHDISTKFKLCTCVRALVPVHRQVTPAKGTLYESLQRAFAYVSLQDTQGLTRSQTKLHVISHTGYNARTCYLSACIYVRIRY